MDESCDDNKRCLSTKHQRSNESEGQWQCLSLWHQQLHKDRYLKDRANSVEMIQFPEQKGGESKILSLSLFWGTGWTEKERSKIYKKASTFARKKNQASFVHSEFQVPMRPASDEQEIECG